MFYAGSYPLTDPANIAPCNVTVTAATAATLNTPAARFVDDGGNNVVCLASCTVSGNVRFRLFQSTDGGLHWTLDLPLGAGITSADVCWNADAGCFVCLDSAGNIYTSATGSGFGLLRTTPITQAFGAETRYNTLASVGSCLAKAFQVNYYGDNIAGVAYSFDMGVTWRLKNVVPTNSVVASRLLSLVAANGRLYGTDGLSVYRSGVVTYRGNDL